MASGHSSNSKETTARSVPGCSSTCSTCAPLNYPTLGSTGSGKSGSTHSTDTSVDFRLSTDIIESTMNVLLTILNFGILLFGLFAFIITAGFFGEANRYPMATIVGLIWGTVVTLVAVVPLILQTYMSWRLFTKGSYLLSPRVHHWIPLVSLICSLALGFGLMLLGEGLVSMNRKANQEKQAKAILALREKLTAHTPTEASYCELVNLDPNATEEEMELCKKRIMSLGSDDQKWQEFEFFIDREFYPKLKFRYWGESQGMTTGSRCEPWFVKTFFTLWMKRHDLKDRKNRAELSGLLQSSYQWSTLSKSIFNQKIAPELIHKLKSEAGWSEKNFNELYSANAADPRPKDDEQRDNWMIAADLKRIAGLSE